MQNGITLAMSLNNLSNCLADTGRPDDAERARSEAVKGQGGHHQEDGWTYL